MLNVKSLFFRHHKESKKRVESKQGRGMEAASFPVLVEWPWEGRASRASAVLSAASLSLTSPMTQPTLAVETREESQQPNSRKKEGFQPELQTRMGAKVALAASLAVLVLAFGLIHFADAGEKRISLFSLPFVWEGHFGVAFQFQGVAHAGSLSQAPIL